jgi:hypothetical protein
MNCPYNYDEPEFRLEWFEVRLAELQLEKDALWIKTQEDEREINDLRDVNKQLRQWKEEALKVMNQWNEVSDYINFNAEVEDFGRFVPQICLKYLKERDELKKLKELHTLNFMSDMLPMEKLQKQRTELLAIAEELADVIIGNGASVKDAIPIDKLDEFYIRWGIKEPFKRNYSA